jgi:hypothetical protein
MGDIFEGGSKIVSSWIEGKAKKAAYSKMMDAWKKVEQIDIDKMTQKALEGDKTFWQESYKFQEELDPVMAQLRKQGGAQLLELLQSGHAYNQMQDEALKQSFAENLHQAPEEAAAIDALIARAGEELAAGATLGPALQSELVRSGLEGAGSAGFQLSRDGATGVGARQLLGTAGEQLKMQRQASAQNLLGTAQQLKQSRAQILGSLIPQTQAVQGQRVNLAGQAQGVGQANVPTIGLTGGDVVNMEEQNRALRNQRTLALGGLKADRRLAEGMMWSGISQGAHQMASGIVSMAAGGGIGGMGGMAGGMMGGK